MMENAFTTGLQNVEVYCENNAFYLKITTHESDSKGDIHEIKIDGIKLDLFKNIEYKVNRIVDHCICDLIPQFRHIIYTGSHEYEVSDNSIKTDKIIHRHTEQYTIEELEQKLGCHLEIVSNKKDNESEEN